MVNCPECDTKIDVDEDELEEGEAVACPECGTDFEVTGINPLELKPVEEGYEDDEEEVAETEDEDA